MADEQYFLRARGRVMGPFDLAHLKSMRARGQLARFHEVSQDRQNWVGAETLADLFAEPARATPAATAPAAGGPTPQQAADTYELGGGPAAPPATAGPDGGGQWFYAVDGKASGPVSFPELRQLIVGSRIDPGSLVWKEGMQGWVPATTINGLGVPAVPERAPQPAEPPWPVDRPRPAPAGPTYPAEPMRTSGLAIASLVLGLVWICGLGSLLAVIFGAISLSQISRSRGTLGGKGMAIAGLVLGILGLSLWLLPTFFGGMAQALHDANRP